MTVTSQIEKLNAVLPSESQYRRTQAAAESAEVALDQRHYVALEAAEVRAKRIVGTNYIGTSADGIGARTSSRIGFAPRRP
jgi:hypothetical protein